MRQIYLFLFCISCANPNIDNKNEDSIYGNNGSNSNNNEDFSPLTEDDASELLQDNDTSMYSDEIDPDYCNDALDEMFNEEEQAQLQGATTYYFGTYVPVDNGWLGREKWILFAIPSWQSMGGYDCEITWNTFATEAANSNCATCDFALQVQASIDESQTNCPTELWDTEDMRSWSESYEVDLSTDESTFYFQGSGNFIGDGYREENSIAFLSDPDCKWF